MCVMEGKAWASQWSDTVNTATKKFQKGLGKKNKGNEGDTAEAVQRIGLSSGSGWPADRHLPLQSMHGYGARLATLSFITPTAQPVHPMPDQATASAQTQP